MNVMKLSKGLLKVQVVIVVLMLVAYVVNFIKFIENDFEAPYKSEIVNAIGVFLPPAASITVWF
jgi:hypothetical protein